MGVAGTQPRVSSQWWGLVLSPCLYQSKVGAGGSTTGGDPEPYPIRVHGASIGPGTAWSLELSAIVYGRLGMGGSGYPDQRRAKPTTKGGWDRVLGCSPLVGGFRVPRPSAVGSNIQLDRTIRVLCRQDRRTRIQGEPLFFRYENRSDHG